VGDSDAAGPESRLNRRFDPVNGQETLSFDEHLRARRRFRQVSAKLRGEIVTFVQHGLTKGGAGGANATISVSTSGRFGYLPIRERGPPGRNSDGGAILGGETSNSVKVRSHRE